MTRIEIANRYVKAGFALVSIPPRSKAPKTRGWQDNPITTLDAAWDAFGGNSTNNMGAILGASGIATLDIDHESWARIAFESIGIDLDDLQTSSEYRIKGARGVKPVFRAPADLDLHSITWPHPTEVDARGKPVMVTIFELRAGPGRQDVFPGSTHPTGIDYTWFGAAPAHVNDLPEPPEKLLDLWRNFALYEPLLIAACPHGPKLEVKHQTTVSTVSSTSAHSGENQDVIGLFNQKFSPAEILERNAYTADRSGKRWTRPGSSSGDAGVLLLPQGSKDGYDVIFSHHAGDLLGDGKPHDAFDCYRILEHTSDYKEAVKQAAQTLGLPAIFSKTRTSATDSADSAQRIPWADAPDELPPATPTVPHLPLHMVPEPLRPWLEDAAARTCVHLEMIAAPALISIAAVIGRQVGICPKAHDLSWVVIPNLWGGVVARAGFLKSPVIAEATRSLNRLAANSYDAFKQDNRTANARKSIIEAEMDALSSKVKAETKAGREGSKFEADMIAKMTDLDNCEVHERRYVTNDTTIEKLGVLLEKNQRGVMLLRDELAGWLKTLDRPGREGDREFYLETWNGDGKYRFDRISRETAPVTGLCLSVLGGIQPGKLRGYVTEALSDGDGSDGLLQRLQVLIYPDTLPAWKNVDRKIDVEAKNKAHAIFTKLDDLDPVSVGATSQDDDVPFMQFVPAAQNLFDAWRDELENRLRSSELEAQQAFASHLAKYRSLMPSLALIFHLVDCVDKDENGPVSLEATQNAASWCEYLELHAAKMYALESPLNAAHALLEKVDEGLVQDGITLRAVYRAGWSGLNSHAKVLAALDVLIESGHVRLETVEREGKGGGVQQVIRLHPSLKRGS